MYELCTEHRRANKDPHCCNTAGWLLVSSWSGAGAALPVDTVRSRFRLLRGIRSCGATGTISGFRDGVAELDTCREHREEVCLEDSRLSWSLSARDVLGRMHDDILSRSQLIAIV